MTLVVFDMDGTLLNAKSELTVFTGETLALMRAAGIPYTVATGRTLQAALGPHQGSPVCATPYLEERCSNMVSTAAGLYS